MGGTGIYVESAHTLAESNREMLLPPGMDYDEASIPASVVIPAGAKRECFNVSIIDDDENELQEEFRVTARLPGSTTDDATASVFINDNDGRPSFGI